MSTLPCFWSNNSSFTKTSDLIFANLALASCLHLKINLKIKGTYIIKSSKLFVINITARNFICTSKTGRSQFALTKFPEIFTQP